MEAGTTPTSQTDANGNGNGHAASADDQQGLFDQVIQNDELETALEDREKIKNSRAALNVKFNEADEKAKGIIAALDLDVDTVVRVGRFRIAKSQVAAKSVAFETEPTERLNISTLDD